MAATAAYHYLQGGQSVGRHPFVRGFIHGTWRLRPLQCTKVSSWDLAVVLEALCKAPFEPIKDTSDKLLTLKTIFLLAISSLKRIGDLQAFAESGLEFALGMARAFIYLRPGYVPKWLTSSAGPIVLQARKDSICCVQCEHLCSQSCPVV